MNKLLIVIGLAASCGMAGCTIEDMVRAPVPKPIQAELGVPAEVPLSSMKDIREQYAQAVADKATAAAAAKAEAVRQIEVSARRVASGYAVKIAALVAQQEAELGELGEAAARESAKLGQLAADAEASARRSLSALAASESKAASKVETLNRLIGGIAELAMPTVTAAFPLAGPLLTLALGGFLYTRKRPGEDATIAAEKEDSYNKGIRVGKEAALAATNAVTLAQVAATAKATS